MSEIFEPVRRIVADAVRSRVVGPNADNRAQELFEAPGERWFAEDRPIRIIHADSCMFIGGLRALLFQSLQPLAMAGVASHSDFKADPWGRLQRTADFLAATTFGPATEAQRAVDMVKRVHTRVVGTADDGRPYSANDPHLLKWVHIAEVDSFLAAHAKFGEIELSPEQRDGYVLDMSRIASALGVIDPPTTVAELADQIASYRPELRTSAPARDAARYLLLTPPLPIYQRPIYGLLGAAAVSLMPLWTRFPLRLPWLPVSERAVVRPAAQALTKTLRWALQPIPITSSEQ
ncbi:MAG: oxygenase MpaB family protein [Actinomycetes bacterium]